MIGRGAFCFEWILEKQQLSRDRRDVKRKATQIDGRNGKEWKGMERKGWIELNPKGKRMVEMWKAGLGTKKPRKERGFAESKKSWKGGPDKRQCFISGLRAFLALLFKQRQFPCRGRVYCHVAAKQPHKNGGQIHFLVFKDSTRRKV